jgi:HK97 family phage major capsid protein
MWGLPLIVSTVMPQGKALVGDFSIGCQLFIREGLNVRMSDSDSDDFLRNRVTVLAEMRAGLATWQPAALR